MSKIYKGALELVGYTPLVDVNNIEEELKLAKSAIDILGGKFERCDNFCLPISDISRNIIIINKIKETPKKYPRKAGTPVKTPLFL